MSDYLLLRGRKALLREVAAAWISIGLGAILFGYISAKWSPSLGTDGAYLEAAVISIPFAIWLLFLIRGGTFTLPALAMPKAKPQPEQPEDEGLKLSEFWKSLNPEEREGLQWLTSMAAAQLVATPYSPGQTLVLPGPKGELLLEVPPTKVGPDEFEFRVKGDPTKKIVTKVDRKKQEISYVLHTGWSATEV